VNDSVLFASILSLLGAFYIGMSYFFSPSVHSKKEFFLGNRSFGTFSIAATLVAAQIGGGMFLGTAQEPVKGLLYIIGLTIGFLVLGFGSAEKYRNFNTETLGHILERRYQSPLLRHLCSIISIISIIGILLGQALAAQSILSYFGGTTAWYLFPLFWMSMVIYTMIGGLNAVIVTDVIQIAIVIIVFTGIFISIILHNPTALFSSQGIQTIVQHTIQTPLSSSDIARLIIVPILFSIITQDLAHRFFAAKNGVTAKMAALYAAIALLFFGFIPFYFGFLAQQEAILVPTGVSPLLPFLRLHTSSFAFVLAACGLIAAIGSTIDGLLCVGSSIIYHLYTTVRKKTSASSVSLSQKTVLIFGILLLASSYFIPNSIIDLLIQSYEISVACLIIPIFFALFSSQSLFWKSGFYAMLGGLSGFIIAKAFGFHTWAFLIALTCSLFCHLIMDFLCFQHKDA